MNNHTHIDDSLGEVDNFWAWKYMTSPILQENDLDQYFNKEVLRAWGRWG